MRWLPTVRSATVPSALLSFGVLATLAVTVRGQASAIADAETPAARSASGASIERIPEELNASDWSSIRAAYEAGRYAAFPANDGFKARNPAQAWVTHFDGRGFTVQPDGGAWTWGLELERYGFAGSEVQVCEPRDARADGARVNYQWDELLEEWWINDARGFEHGYTVHRRPEGGVGPLAFELAVRGELAPHVEPERRSARFVDAQGAAAVTYAGLFAHDAAGRALACGLRIAPGRLLLCIDERDAQYPLTIDPVAQQAYLKASNTGPSDLFGVSISVSGDTVVVGARNEDSNATGINGNQNNNFASNSGAAYVFVRNGTIWSQQAYLKASNTDAGDEFGYSVSISGDTIVVGADREDSTATGVNGNQASDFATDSGAAYVFVRNGASWSQQAYLKASNTGIDDLFGVSVSISGDTVVVGALQESSNATGVNGNQSSNSAQWSGAAYVFVRSGTTWTQQAYLKASNTGPIDWFGYPVSISGDTIVVGASKEDSNATGVNGDQSNNSATDSGAAYIFVRSGSTWSQEAYLKASNTNAFDTFGYSVGVYGDTVAVGARDEDSNATGVNGNQADNSAVNSGAAYVFTRSGSSWSPQAYLKASNSEQSDALGQCIAIFGDLVVAGAHLEDSSATGVNGDQSNNGASSSGAAYVFVRNGTQWSQQAYVKASNTDVSDMFGNSVSIDGNTLVVGAPTESSSATGVNGDQSSNSASGSGAAYVFDLPPPPAVYCTSKTNSLGCTPQVAFAGVPQISGTGAFDLTASMVLNNKNGLWFYGTNGLQAVAFQDGHLCVKAPIKRLMLRSTAGNPPPNDCSGSVTENFNDKIRGLNGYTIDPALSAGAFVGSQFWSRDPASPSTTSLTAGISFTISP